MSLEWTESDKVVIFELIKHIAAAYISKGSYPSGIPTVSINLAIEIHQAMKSEGLMPIEEDIFPSSEPTTLVSEKQREQMWQADREE